MAVAPARCALPDRLHGLHSRQGARCGRGAREGGLPGAGRESARAEGIAGHLDRADRRRQVLAAGGHGTEESRREGYLHCLRRWVEGLSGSH